MNRLVTSLALRASPSTLNSVSRARLLLPQTFNNSLPASSFSSSSYSLLLVRSFASAPSNFSSSSPIPNKGESMAESNMRKATDKSMATGMKDAFEEVSKQPKDAAANAPVDYTTQPKPAGGYGYGFNEYKAGKNEKDITGKAMEKVYEATKSAERASQSFSSQTEDMKKAAKGVKDEAVNKASEVKDKAMEKAGDMKDKAMEKAGELKDKAMMSGSAGAMVNKAEEVKDKVMEKAGQIKDQAMTMSTGDMMDKAKEVKDKVVDKAVELKDEAVQAGGSTAGNMLDKAMGKAVEMKDKAMSGEMVDNAMEKAGEMKDKVMEKAEEMKDKVVGTASAADVMDKATELKDKALDTAGDMTSKTMGMAADLKDKALDKAVDLKDKIVHTVEESNISEKLIGAASTVAVTVAEKAKMLKDVAVEKAMTAGGSALGVAAKKMEDVGKKLQEGGEKMHQTAEESQQQAAAIKNENLDKESQQPRSKL